MGKIFFNDKRSYDYFQAFLASLHSLSDKGSQLKAWQNGDYSNYTSFDEVCMQFFHLAEDILTWDLSKSKISLIEGFYTTLEDYQDCCGREDRAEQEIIKDPEWHRLVLYARSLEEQLKDIEYVD